MLKKLIVKKKLKKLIVKKKLKKRKIEKIRTHLKR